MNNPRETLRRLKAYRRERLHGTGPEWDDELMRDVVELLERIATDQEDAA